MKLAVVVQRYGTEINGGAELHARYVAEHLARHAWVDVLTTCAVDYISWANALPPGTDTVNGVPVRRFPVAHPRDPASFGRWSRRVFGTTHSLADELRWLDSEGPASPALVRHLDRHGSGYDYVIFFSYRYYHTYHGVRAAAPRAVLVPTAERDAAIGLALFGPIFRAVRAVMYNSHEERAMIQGVSGNHDVPGVVVGVGSEVPADANPERGRARYRLHRPYAVYIGRIDTNKGCAELFAHFQQYARGPGGLDLVLIGKSVMEVPDHPRIRLLGFLSEADKYDVLAGAAVLVMPSYFESLSMVTLEAWAMGVPVLANGACDVLRGQVLRGNAGLYYTNLEEFVETLGVLENHPRLRRGLGMSGQRYFERNYTWPVIERKYLTMLERLREEDAEGAGRQPEPLPGWFDRRRRTIPPAETVAARLPAGPVLPPPERDRRADLRGA